MTSLDGARIVREHMGANVRTEHDAHGAGERLAALLVEQGAEEVLAAIRSAHPVGPGRGATGR